MAPTCAHEQLCLGPSTHAQRAGYARQTPQQLIAATRPSGRAFKSTEGGNTESCTFPSPLVLPGDDLSWDPKYDPQNLKSWLKEKDRNPVTDERKTIYVAPVPSVDARVRYVKEWVQPMLSDDTAKKKASIARPNVADVVEYLTAFYTNLPVKLLSKPKLQFTSWGDDQATKKRAKVSYVALSIGSEAVRIRARPSNDSIFARQLNLEDILDAAMAILPSDAYALLLLVDHDLYEEEDNDFCCGRAYGGSRVAAVSSARYNPVLDTAQQVEREHAWPASHCQKYVDTYVKNANDSGAPARKKEKTSMQTEEHKDTPDFSSSAMQAAVRAFTSVPNTSQSEAAFYGLLDCAERHHTSLATALAWIIASSTPVVCISGTERRRPAAAILVPCRSRQDADGNSCRLDGAIQGAAGVLRTL
ncbi:hypothetical protein V7S43_011555 [Phytophthora oleae]|uniref:Uncharacterized protein n=1 Tax=Phytophthora oleae TaxID=2107226 RepID=A0ABD3FCC2_9STRA